MTTNIKAYVEKAVPLKGADSISVMLTVPKKDWPDVSRLVMQDVVIGLASEQEPPDPTTPVDPLTQVRDALRAATNGVEHLAGELQGYRIKDGVYDNVPRPCGATPPSGGLFEEEETRL